MRALLLLVLASVVPLAAFGQSHPRPKGLLNANWGASRMEVMTILKQHGATIPEEDPGGDKLLVTGGSFANQEVVSWSFDFAAGKMYSASVTLRSSDSGSALYRELKQQLISKYGPHSGEGKLTESREERRVRSASGLPAPKRGTTVVWKFSPTLQDKESMTITCELAPPENAPSTTEDESSFLVTLRYTNETMKAQALKAAATPEPAAPAKTARGVKPDDL